MSHWIVTLVLLAVVLKLWHQTRRLQAVIDRRGQPHGEPEPGVTEGQARQIIEQAVDRHVTEFHKR